MLNDNQRQKAIDWLNSRGRDFTAGMKILEASGFKPGVVRRLKSIGESDDAKMHLVENIRLYLRFFGCEIEDTDAELGVFDGQQPEELNQKDENKGQTLEMLAVKVEAGETDAPEGAGRAIIEYAKLYRAREKAHREMAKVAESNDDEHVAARRKLSDTIDILTTKMEKLYPLVSGFLDNGTVPEAEAVETALADDEPKAAAAASETAEVPDLTGLSKEELQKRLKSAKTKILRKSNLLDYQQETKAEVPNPLPDCPKRVKYETEIAALKEEVKSLQYAIARKG